jgi:hypothetical protein
MAKARSTRRANPAPAAKSRGDAALRERVAVLEAREQELRQANEELTRERTALRERAGVIEQRYAELVERAAASAPSAPAGPAAAEVQALREQLDHLRREREAASKTKRFWMVCPKCGARLEEVEHEQVKVDRCPGCGGMFLDKGEVEAITSREETASFFVSIRSLFG